VKASLNAALSLVLASKASPYFLANISSYVVLKIGIHAL
jgi:hypothetical protein